jgi:steroid delta-isomerase-like uncharacterized protein
MLIEENKAIIERVYDQLWNHRNLDILDELWSPVLDIAGFKAWTHAMYASFGEMQMTNLGMIAEGDQVAIHWRATAIHQGDYLGVAATGRSISYQGISWHRLADGKIIEAPGYWDNLDVLQQLGATTIPTPATS